MSRKQKYHPGFTIVELLIVIVVIGILAGITIVAYNGIQNQARVSIVKNDLSSVAGQLAVDLTLNGMYPTTLAAVNDNKGAKASSGTTYQYTVNNSVQPAEYCVTAMNGNSVYRIDQTRIISSGACSGHTSGIAAVPVRSGYQDFTGSGGTNGNTVTITPPGSIPNGAWMIAVFAFNELGNFTVPTGWTPLIMRETTNTMQVSMFARIKAAGDPASYGFDMNTGGSGTNAALLWGTGSAPIGSWALGSYGKRNVNGTSTTNVAPSVTTTVNNSLVLSFSMERTNAYEADAAPYIGAEKWFFNPQSSTDALRFHSIAVAYTEQAVPTATPTVTFTYPNVQTLNGIAFQLVIPPAN